MASEPGEDEARVRVLLHKEAQLGQVTAAVTRYCLRRRIEQFAALIRQR